MNRSGKRLNIRERFFKWIFLTSDKYKIFVSWFSSLCRFFFTISLSLFILGFLFYIGFSNSTEARAELESTFRILFLILFLSKYLPELLSFKKGKTFSFLFRTLVFVFSLAVFLSNISGNEKPLREFFNGFVPLMTAIFLIASSEIYVITRLINSVRFPPSLLFSLSFLLIILIGSGLLMMPNARTGPLSFLDSLFTSVSAVCVTGLTVVNTATTFTTTGKIIVLCLIQVGGLGIMTFTGFFSFIFTSGSSIRDSMVLKEIFSSESLNNLFKILVKIILITFLTEIAGALIVLGSLGQEMPDKILFSVFHSVSAFCNAGFSTLTDNLFSAEASSNYTIQTTISFLIILGGIGFPVLIKVYSFVKHHVMVLIRRLMRKRTPVRPGQRNVSVAIVLFTTLLLVAGGSILYYLFENKGSLAGLTSFQKIMVSFFGSVSARTAGFNIVDITRWSYPTIFLMIFLMWIGASPGSTGGGIKTTTFAIAFRSVWNNIRGRDYLKIGNREVGTNTITRVLTIIFLSVLVIGTGFFSLLLSEPGKNPSHLLFECFSAFGTVGLSIADTSTFSDAGKVVDIILMFTGRVGPLTLLTGFMLSHRKRYARYPEIEIMIN